MTCVNIIDVEFNEINNNINILLLLLLLLLNNKYLNKYK
jgi:hypothetical protein